MVEAMKNKRNHKRNIVNNDKGMFNSIIKLYSCDFYVT